MFVCGLCVGALCGVQRRVMSGSVSVCVCDVVVFVLSKHVVLMCVVVLVPGVV